MYVSPDKLAAFDISGQMPFCPPQEVLPDLCGDSPLPFFPVLLCFPVSMLCEKEHWSFILDVV